MQDMTVDANGSIHSDTTGRFTGHVQVEGDPEDVLGQIEAERAAQAAAEEEFRRTRAHILKVVRALDRQTGKTNADNSIDLEDTVQQIHAELLRVKANGTVIGREEALVNSIARGIFREVGWTRVPSEDRTAIIKLGAWRAAFMNDNDREPTRKEVDAEARRMREEWPDPRHRPTKDFHLWSHGAMSAPTSIYSEATDAEGGMRRDLQLPIADHPFSAPTGDIRWAEVAESCVSRGDFSEGNMRDARTFLYPAMAQRAGAAVPQAGFMAKASVQSARDAVKGAGGIDEVIADFKAGRQTAAVEAMFRPWSSSATSHSERVEIVKVLELQRGGAEEMWGSALRFASRDQLPRITHIVGAWQGGAV